MDDFESDFELSESASLAVAPYQFEPVSRDISSAQAAISSSDSEDDGSEQEHHGENGRVGNTDWWV